MRLAPLDSQHAQPGAVHRVIQRQDGERLPSFARCHGTQDRVAARIIGYALDDKQLTGLAQPRPSGWVARKRQGASFIATARSLISSIDPSGDPLTTAYIGAWGSTELIERRGARAKPFRVVHDRGKQGRLIRGLPKSRM